MIKNEKRLLQTVFALCVGALFATGCSNEQLTTGNDAEEGGEASVSFNLGLPQGDEVNYTRATAQNPTQDLTEWAVKTVKVYHFSTTVTSSPADTDYTLVKAYDLSVQKAADATEKPGAGECVDYGDGSYNLRVSLRSDAVGTDKRHKFAVIANDACTEFDTKAATTPVTLADLKQGLADKKLNNDTNGTDLFMGSIGGLCMTATSGDLELTAGVNDQTATALTLTRIMARLDVKSFVSANKMFVLKSVALKYDKNMLAPQAYLFEPAKPANIWYNKDRATMTVTQNPKYNTLGYPDYDSYTTEPDWVAQATLSVDGVDRMGTWYKKVLYMYPYPTTVDGRSLEIPKLLVTYTLNDIQTTKEVAMKNPTTTLPFDIKRNYAYILQVGDPNSESDELGFSFSFAEWSAHETDADLNEGTDVAP